jgi:4-alpha-glucanotransferase
MSGWHVALEELAYLVGVETGYWEVDGTHHQASPEVLVEIFRALGVEIDRPDQAGEAVARFHVAKWRRPIDPSVSLISGEPLRLGVRVPASVGGRIALAIELESGGEVHRELEFHECAVAYGAEADGESFVERRIELEVDLPAGYHRMRVEGQGVSAIAHLLCTPRRAFAGPGELRTWGLFAPVYGLRSANQLGVGDLGDLGELSRMVRSRGGTLIGTLPLLACFYDRPHHNPSPYSPVTRLFWNELFADVRPDAWRRLGLPGASAPWADPELAEAAAPLAELPLVDYRRAAALRRQALSRLSREAWSDPAARARIEAFAVERPRVADYAQFRAHTETTGLAWGSWSAAEQGGDLRGAALDEELVRYHLFAQLVLREQLAELKGADGGVGLYLDLPVGVDSAGYDLWRERDAFASGVSVGAPPDPLARGGQNWAVPPLHPVRQREDGYRYFRDCVRAHMEHAAMLRVDHVMGLHRLFWIPSGGSAADGIYVRYPADELYAILCIESHRHRCAVAGEDLGTVPEYVRPTMAERGVHGLFVGEFEWSWQDGTPRPHQPRPGAVASLDTHDTPTFAAFAVREHFSDHHQVMTAWTEDLARGPADVLLVTLEDLWLETEPQNVPGTYGDDTANWRRRTRLDLPTLITDPRVTNLLDRVAALRRPA